MIHIFMVLMTMLQFVGIGTYTHHQSVADKSPASLASKKHKSVSEPGDSKTSFFNVKETYQASGIEKSPPKAHYKMYSNNKYANGLVLLAGCYYDVSDSNTATIESECTIDSYYNSQLYKSFSFDSYKNTTKINDIVFSGSNIFVATNNGIYSGDYHDFVFSQLHPVTMSTFNVTNLVYNDKLNYLFYMIKPQSSVTGASMMGWIDIKNDYKQTDFSISGSSAKLDLSNIQNMLILPRDNNYYIVLEYTQFSGDKSPSNVDALFYYAKIGFSANFTTANPLIFVSETKTLFSITFTKNPTFTSSNLVDTELYQITYNSKQYISINVNLEKYMANIINIDGKPDTQKITPIFLMNFTVLNSVVSFNYITLKYTLSNTNETVLMSDSIVIVSHNSNKKTDTLYLYADILQDQTNLNQGLATFKFNNNIKVNDTDITLTYLTNLIVNKITSPTVGLVVKQTYVSQNNAIYNLSEISTYSQDQKLSSRNFLLKIASNPIQIKLRVLTYYYQNFNQIFIKYDPAQLVTVSNQIENMNALKSIANVALMWNGQTGTSFQINDSLASSKLDIKLLLNKADDPDAMAQIQGLLPYFQFNAITKTASFEFNVIISSTLAVQTVGIHASPNTIVTKPLTGYCSDLSSENCNVYKVGYIQNSSSDIRNVAASIFINKLGDYDSYLINYTVNISRVSVSVKNNSASYSIDTSWEPQQLNSKKNTIILLNGIYKLDINDNLDNHKTCFIEIGDENFKIPTNTNGFPQEVIDHQSRLLYIILSSVIGGFIIAIAIADLIYLTVLYFRKKKSVNLSKNKKLQPKMK